MGDWQPGDLALCVRGEASQEPTAQAISGHKKARRGGVYKVEQFLLVAELYPALVLEGHHSAHSSRAWCASCFVKITPGHKIEGSEVDQRNPWKVGQDA